MDAVQARLEALERRADGHGDRIGAVERQQAATEAKVDALREDVKETKQASQRAATSVDALVRWMLSAAAIAALNLLYMLLKGAGS